MLSLELVNVAVYGLASMLFLDVPATEFLGRAVRKSPLSLQTWALGAVMGCLLLEARFTALLLLSPLLVTANAAVQGDRARQELRIDPKTGVLTLIAFEEEIARLSRSGRRQDERVHLVMVDIDHFREVNGRHGHLVGDAVLVKVAECLLSEVRSLDLCARFGGEEFVLALRGLSAAEAVDVCERVRTRIAALPLRGEGGATFLISASFGVAPLTPSRPLHEALAEADKCLYAAKAAGRNRVVPATSLAVA